ncbi:ficolin-1-like [Anopheles aquasalis]|uniref:ficolin-1-like n=1 Tax=Anopheles aquasalis TaxID=42839 RepID=UPI00215B5BD5|nr:ficolin-1-like [Anopheles aquasalis]
MLEVLLNRLDDMERKLSDLQTELKEHREEVERNRIPDCVLSTPAPPELNSTTPTTLPTTSTTQPTETDPEIYTSCQDTPIKVSGVYSIRVKNDSEPIKVYCEMEKFRGGWIVLQHRFDGSVDFYRDWVEYREGFGDLNSEFWLGLEHVHQLTTSRKFELIVELEDFNGNSGYARYNAFQIGSEKEKYKLKNVGPYIGSIGMTVLKVLRLLSRR